MTHVAYLAAGYGVTITAIAAYAGWVVRRKRALSARLGPVTGRPPGRGVRAVE